MGTQRIKGRRYSRTIAITKGKKSSKLSAPELELGFAALHLTDLTGS